MSELSYPVDFGSGDGFHSRLQDIIFLCCFVLFCFGFFGLRPSGVPTPPSSPQPHVLARQTRSGFSGDKSDSKIATSLSLNSSARSHFGGVLLIQCLQQPKHIKNPSNEITVLIMSYQVGRSQDLGSLRLADSVFSFFISWRFRGGRTRFLSGRDPSKQVFVTEGL